jgi:hypothetical protein
MQQINIQNLRPLSFYIPTVSTTLVLKDYLGAMKVRWAIDRNNFRVDAGLYKVGKPTSSSDVFVTANYKLSFDTLRKNLKSIDAWILVLDTKGINVWCAAGKGTFGTKELVKRIKTHDLEKIVNHRKVIVPQLGAVGISAHEVKNSTGFRVVYGPVRAEDITDFVSSGYKATPKMRRVTFPLIERAKLIPVELAYGKYYLLLIPAIFLILSGLNMNGYSIDFALKSGGLSVTNLLGAYIAGCVLNPILLPWIPFRRFSLKGLLLGWIIAAVLLYFQFLGSSVIENISWFLIMGGISSFLAMNFTGASTFTSLSGVQKEMKLALPLQIAAVSIGFIGWITVRFI